MPARTSKPEHYTSHTELSLLAKCEMAWHLRYQEGVKGEASDAMRKGTLVHVGAAASNAGKDWRLAIAEAIVEEGADASLVDLDAFDVDTPESDAVWLLERYRRHYGDQNVKVIATELELLAVIPGTDGSVHMAIIDEVWEVLGDLWVVERKTYGKGTRLAYVEVDPQLTLNLWTARQNGIDAVGIVFDGIYTYRWKPEKPTQKALIEERSLTDIEFRGWTKKAMTEWARAEVERHPGIERPDADSFTRLWLDRNDEHIEAALADVAGTVERRVTLRSGGRPVRNIGPDCQWCDQRTSCWERLAFPQEIVFDAD